MRRRSDDGAVAVLVVLVVIGLLLPLSALGLNNYVRIATIGEAQRAADSGALAGAASIPLADPAAVLDILGLPPVPPTIETPDVETGIDVVPDTDVDPSPDTEVMDVPVPVVLPAGAPDALRRACVRTRVAALQDGALSATYARPTTTRVSGPARCAEGPAGQPVHIRDSDFVSARFLNDISTFAEARQCASALAALGPDALPPPGPLPDPGPLPAPPSEGVPDLAALGRLLPALLRPGVEVRVRQGQVGPLEGILGSGGARESTVTAIARRRFKNVVVVPVLNAPAVGPITLAPDVARTTDDARTVLDDLADRIEDPTAGLPLPELPGSVPLGDALDDLRDVVDEVSPVPVPAPTLPPGVPPPPVEPPDVPGSVGLPDPRALRPVPPSCTGAMRALAQDYDDLVQPTEGRDQSQVLAEAACLPGSRCAEEGGTAGVESVLTVMYDPTRAAIYDVVPVCFPNSPRTTPTPEDVLRDADGDLIPDSVQTFSFQRQAEGEAVRYLNGARCAPGSPGGFRASLSRS